jgi:transglutaminase-like putative cysteine protease
MKKFFGILALIICSFFYSIAADIKYPVSEIPDSLRKGMYAVIRSDYSRFEILAINKSSLHVRHVITILNEKAKSYAALTVGYDKNTKIVSLRGIVYDALGGEIRKLKQNEIYDQSSISGFSLYEDDRLKRADLSQSTYPYTVEYEYEIQYNYLYSIPGFTLFRDDEISIQESTFIVVYPKTISPRFKETLVPAPAKINLPLEKQSVTWAFKNERPEKFEAYSPSYLKVTPNIRVAPSSFQYDSYSGDMSSWRSYGAWNALLNKERDMLPEPTKQKVKELTNGLATTEQKSKVLYEYLQSKTRYVSIQLGIGGLQPFPASVVDETGYGDCKALSNYMVAMLKEAGIKGYYTTIQAGDNEPDVIADFPSHQANHVIVCVPAGKDTLWMECTSQTRPFNYMGTFTGDRYALMITDDGGKLVRTPAYTAEQNKQARNAEVFIDKLGNGKASVITRYSGTQYENNGLSFLLGNQFDDQKKWIQNNTEIPSFTVNSFSMTEIKDRIPSAIVKIDLVLPRYASVSGKRVFISPNLMNKVSYIPEKATQRKNEIVRHSNYLDIDSVTLHFPPDLYPEFLPAPAKINSRFGEYETSYKFDEGKLVYVRKMKVWKGQYPKESYNEMVDFYKNISKADNIKLVFLSKT